MNYYELIFCYDSSIHTEIINDVLAAELGEIGFESFSTTEEGLLGYIDEKKYDKKEVENRLAQFPIENVTFSYKEKYIESKDWNEEWEKNYFQPISIGQDCIIHASFHNVKPIYKYDITIDPKMAFGTGNHETTSLMIEEMLKLDLKDKAVLDMGCGTAVLAIIASMKEAGRIAAIDIDEWAYKNALENIRLNQTLNIEIKLGGAEQIQGFEKFNIIFANINRNILLKDIQTYVAGMKPEALLYMSGFYVEDIPMLINEGKKYGLSFISHTEKNNWAAIKMQLLST